MAEMCLTDLNQVFTIRLACTSQISIDVFYFKLWLLFQDSIDIFFLFENCILFSSLTYENSADPQTIHHKLCHLIKVFTFCSYEYNVLLKFE